MFLQLHNPNRFCPDTTELSDLFERSLSIQNLIDHDHKEFTLIKQGIRALEEEGDLSSKSFLAFGKQK